MVHENNGPATGGVRFKTGVVSAADGNGNVRVFFEDVGMTSYWLPVCYPKTSQDKFYWTPDVGEHVRCLMDEQLEDGAVLGALYSDQDAVPWASPDQCGVVFKDGGSFTYDRSTGKAVVNVVSDLAATVGGNLDFKVTGNITGEAANIKLTAAETVIDGNLRVKGATMLEGGVGGAAGVSTPIPGSVKAEEDVVAGDISLLQHHHDDPQGGQTSEARP